MFSSLLKHRMVRIALIVLIGFTMGFNAVAVRAQNNVTTLNVFIDGDTNISDWWLKTIIPAFTKKFPQYNVIVSITRGAGTNQLIAQRALAALQTGADPQVDYFEEFEPYNYPDMQKAGLFVKIDEKNVPNIKNV